MNVIVRLPHPRSRDSQCQETFLAPSAYIWDQYKYINDLTDNLNSNVKQFADDTSLFSEICGPLETANALNNDLRKIKKCAQQWKTVFNSDPTKQAQEVFFSRKHPEF